MAQIDPAIKDIRIVSGRGLTPPQLGFRGLARPKKNAAYWTEKKVSKEAWS